MYMQMYIHYIYMRIYIHILYTHVGTPTHYVCMYVCVCTVSLYVLYMHTF